MHRLKPFILLLLFVSFQTARLVAQKPVRGSISGTVIEKNSNQPLEFTQVTLKKVNDASFLQGTVTDKKGTFRFDQVAVGEYIVSYSFIGYEKVDAPAVSVTAKRLKIDLGILLLSESNQNLAEVEVTGRKSTYVNSIDRKTFNVGEDLMSQTGSLSDLLVNVPSVQVDIDGNISLRGSENVTILVNGKPSAMMNLNRAAVLQQMSANSIEKIEVITNPSAKYKPDGTSGIINIVLKKNKSLGLNGNVIANVGNDDRYNGNVTVNYNPGKFNLFGNISFRQDDRRRINDLTTHTFSAGKETSLVKNNSESYARPTNTITGLGAEYKLNDRNSVGLTGTYNYRFQRQTDASVYTTDSATVQKEDFNRDRYLPEMESDLEFVSFFRHNFGKEGHDLNLNYTSSYSKEYEDNYYTNIYRLPRLQTNYDNMFYHHWNNVSQFLAEYANAFSEESKLEAGYELDHTHNDMDLHRDTTAMNQTTFVQDFSRSSRFVRTEYTHVLYLTYEREMGKFGFLAGLRGEVTRTIANLVSANSAIESNYNRLYPTMHLSYKLTGQHELQLNYSHRIRRPEDEQLNPFPEYQDLRNLRKGNPYLKPEDIHSFELGYQFKKNAVTFVSTLYCRFNYNGITSITTIHGDTLVSTLQNLAKSTAAGLELVLSANMGKLVTFNISSNTFYNTIDASALGYSRNKANVSLMVNASAGINLTKSTVWQLSSNYTGEQLTPQGKRLPSFVLNSGLKQEVFGKKAALLFTVSDLLNSLRYKSEIDTPELQRFENRKRSARIFYCGFTYNFGKSGKKPKEPTLKYDNQL